MHVNIELTLVQKKQAALLYYFSSVEYLKKLDELVDDLRMFVDAILSKAKNEHRDQVLVDTQWGTRNASENWGNYAWPFMADFKRSLLTDIANRAFDHYQETGTNQFMRATDEFSLQWTTPEEQKDFEAKIRKIDDHGLFIDQTVRRDAIASRWNDFTLALTWQAHADQFRRLPRFRVVTGVEGVTDQIPPRTGVYIPQDDIHGALQFAWAGRAENRRDGRLLESPTFNDIGLHALKVVGRRDLWHNAQKMYAFAMRPEYASLFQKHLHLERGVFPELGPSAVSRYAFTSRPCKWYFVQMIEGEFEDYDDNTIAGVIDNRLRVEAGNQCPRAGYYFTPASPKSRRYFEHGEIMPTIKSELWMTIWQSEE